MNDLEFQLSSFDLAALLAQRVGSQLPCIVQVGNDRAELWPPKTFVLDGSVVAALPVRELSAAWTTYTFSELSGAVLLRLAPVVATDPNNRLSVDLLTGPATYAPVPPDEPRSAHDVAAWLSSQAGTSQASADPWLTARLDDASGPTVAAQLQAQGGPSTDAQNAEDAIMLKIALAVATQLGIGLNLPNATPILPAPAAGTTPDIQLPTVNLNLRSDPGVCSLVAPPSLDTSFAQRLVIEGSPGAASPDLSSFVGLGLDTLCTLQGELDVEEAIQQLSSPLPGEPAFSRLQLSHNFMVHAICRGAADGLASPTPGSAGPAIAVSAAETKASLSQSINLNDASQRLFDQAAGAANAAMAILQQGWAVLLAVMEDAAPSWGGGAEGFLNWNLTSAVNAQANDPRLALVNLTTPLLFTNPSLYGPPSEPNRLWNMLAGFANKPRYQPWVPDGAQWLPPGFTRNFLVPGDNLGLGYYVSALDATFFVSFLQSFATQSLSLLDLLRWVQQQRVAIASGAPNVTGYVVGAGQFPQPASAKALMTLAMTPIFQATLRPLVLSDGALGKVNRWPLSEIDVTRLDVTWSAPSYVLSGEVKTRLEGEMGEIHSKFSMNITPMFQPVAGLLLPVTEPVVASDFEPGPTMGVIELLAFTAGGWLADQLFGALTLDVLLEQLSSVLEWVVVDVVQAGVRWNLVPFEPSQYGGMIPAMEEAVSQVYAAFEGTADDKTASQIQGSSPATPALLAALGTSASAMAVGPAGLVFAGRLGRFATALGGSTGPASRVVPPTVPVTATVAPGGSVMVPFGRATTLVAAQDPDDREPGLHFADDLSVRLVTATYEPGISMPFAPGIMGLTPGNFDFGDVAAALQLDEIGLLAETGGHFFIPQASLPAFGLQRLVLAVGAPGNQAALLVVTPASPGVQLNVTPFATNVLELTVAVVADVNNETVGADGETLVGWHFGLTPALTGSCLAGAPSSWTWEWSEATAGPLAEGDWLASEGFGAFNIGDGPVLYARWMTGPGSLDLTTPAGETVNLHLRVRVTDTTNRWVQRSVHLKRLSAEVIKEAKQKQAFAMQLPDEEANFFAQLPAGLPGSESPFPWPFGNDDGDPMPWGLLVAKQQQLALALAQGQAMAQGQDSNWLDGLG